MFAVAIEPTQRKLKRVPLITHKQASSCFVFNKNNKKKTWNEQIN